MADDMRWSVGEGFWKYARKAVLSLTRRRCGKLVGHGLVADVKLVSTFLKACLICATRQLTIPSDRNVVIGIDLGEISSNTNGQIPNGRPCQRRRQADSITKRDMPYDAPCVVMPHLRLSSPHNDRPLPSICSPEPQKTGARVHSVGAPVGFPRNAIISGEETAGECVERETGLHVCCGPIKRTYFGHTFHLRY